MSMKDLITRGSRSTEVAAPSRDEPNPFLSLHRQMDRLFDDFFRDFGAPLARGAAWGGGWPHVEVEENDGDYKFTAELPGLDDKDVDVTLREGVLTLKGEKRAESSGDNKSGRYSERWFGKFARSFDLGPDVDPDRVSAAFKSGVLTVTIGKRPDAPQRVRHIPVSKE